MEIRIPSPKHYESYYGTSNLVRAYLDQIEKTLGEVFPADIIEIMHISLLIASPEELANGKFLAYEKYDWQCGYASVGVNGNFERYHYGNDFEKICELSEMLQAAFIRVGKKRKAKFNSNLAIEAVLKITNDFSDNFSKE